MNFGHKSPSSKESAVPETAPTAKKMAVPFAQRRARSSHRVARLHVAPLGEHHQERHGHSHHREDDVKPERYGHLDASREQIVHDVLKGPLGRRADPLASGRDRLPRH